MNQETSLYRYYLYAVLMKENLNKENPGEFVKGLNNHPSSTYLILSSPVGIYMTYFYSALYVVAEGWKDLKIEDEKINKLLESSNLDNLKRFRNGTFHFQKSFLSPKLFEFLKVPDSEKWIKQLYKEFGRFFSDTSPDIPSEITEQLKKTDSKGRAQIIQNYFFEKK